MNIRRVLGGLAAAAILSVLVYAVLAALSDAQSVAATLREFPLEALAAMVALTLVSYGVRVLRWRFLMGNAGYPVGIGDAAYLQLSGFTMTVTPGKVGEVLKAFLARDVAGMGMSTGVTLVFVERLADLIAVLVLSVGGMSVLGGGWLALVAAGVAVAVGTITLSSPRFHGFALRAIEKREWARKHQHSSEAMAEALRISLAPGALAVSVLGSLLVWGLEGLAFALCLRALGFFGLTVAAAVSVYAVSTIIGALTFLPGGIGITEASIAGLLVAAGMPAPAASAATLLIRLVTLWLGVAVGWIALATRPRELRRLLGAEAQEVTGG